MRTTIKLDFEVERMEPLFATEIKRIIIDRVIDMWFLHLRILQTINFYCS